MRRPALRQVLFQFKTGDNYVIIQIQVFELYRRKQEELRQRF
jgi:hypothetical protein